MSETITLIGCQICGAQMSVKRINHSFPPEGERCAYCEKLVCFDCIDWEYMMEQRMTENVCMQCGEKRK